MLSSVTLALAMLTVTADAPGKPAGYRLADYARKSESKAATARVDLKSPTGAVRLAQAPNIVPGSASPQFSAGPLPPTAGAYGVPSFHDSVVDSFDAGPVDFGGAPCNDCGPIGYAPYGHRHVSVWSLHGLPGVWHSPGDMHQHVPYLAMPKNYYYFRPYQWFHIPEQQAEVTSYGGDPRHPYANREFQEIYQEFETPPAIPSFEVEPVR